MPTRPAIPEPPDTGAPALSEAEARVLARSPAQAFRHGLVQTLPFQLVILPFAILFGVMATEAGFDLAQVMGFSILVLAGASQFTAVQLLSDHVPVLLILASSLAVNLRMAMYSASLVPWLGAASMRERAAVAYLLIDQSYAMSIQHYERHPQLSLAQRLGYFFGAAAGLCPSWVFFSFVGATMGDAIPADVPLDFAMPITFIAMIAPMLRTLAHLAACLVAVLLALALSGLPNGFGLLIAAPLGMLAGALVETATETQLRRPRG